MTTVMSSVFERISKTSNVSFSKGWHHLSFQALGSSCRVQFAAPQAAAKGLCDRILGWIAEFEARYSRFVPGSLVCRINDAAGREWVAIDPETEQLLTLCGEIHFITKGVFDPTALPLIKLWD